MWVLKGSNITVPVNVHVSCVGGQGVGAWENRGQKGY